MHVARNAFPGSVKEDLTERSDTRFWIRREKERISSPAAGGAAGYSPISIIIPCRRPVGTGGSLAGYAGGIDQKIPFNSYSDRQRPE